MNEDIYSDTDDEGDDVEIPRIVEVDAMVNLLRYALRWSDILDDGNSNLRVKLVSALNEAVRWREKLMS